MCADESGRRSAARIGIEDNMKQIAILGFGIVGGGIPTVLAENAEFPEEVIERAKNEGLTLLYSDLPVYETAVRLFKAGV